MNTFFSLLGSLTIPLLTVYFTVHFSLKKYYLQKKWEEKAKLYSEVIQSLSFLKHCFWNESIHSDDPSQVSPVVANYVEKFSFLTGIANTGSYLITNTATNKLKDLLKTVDSHVKYENPENPEERRAKYWKWAKSTENILEEIKEEADKDLKFHERKIVKLIPFL